MKSMLVYEWDIETLDEHGDIQDHAFAECLSNLRPPEDNQRLVLVRDIIETDKDDPNPFGSVVCRDWAYVKDGALPVYFEDTDRKVPGRFHTELRRWIKSNEEAA